MNGIEAMKLMLDGKVVQNYSGTKYKLENKRFLRLSDNNIWVDCTSEMGTFLSISNYKEYKEQSEIKRKVLVIDGRVGYINISFKKDSLECGYVVNCDEILCIDCPLSHSQTIPATDKRIVEINISKEMEK